MSFGWFIVNIVAGRESIVVKSIRDEAKKLGISDSFGDIVVPTETRFDLKRGKKVETKKKALPGYVMIYMDMSESVWGMIKRLPNVIGLLGSDTKPVRVPDKEIREILKRIEDKSAANNVTDVFEVGESVRIADGPFESFLGSIEKVDLQKGRLVVLVSILGRDAPVDLDFSQVRRV